MTYIYITIYIYVYIYIYVCICNYLVGGVYTIVYTTYILPLMFPPTNSQFFTSSC